MKNYLFITKYLLFRRFQLKSPLKLKFYSPLLLATLLFSNSSLYAQQKVITGIVTDVNSQPLQGVSVKIKGTTIGKITSNDGSYSINARKGQVVEYTFVGKIPQEIIVGSQNVINVSLKNNDLSKLEDVVVIGYGTEKKATLSGSVATIGSEKFENLPLTNPIAALQGALPGVLVQRASGRPGDQGYTINVRGFSSVNGADQALVIIDGVPGDLSQLNPDDIQSVTVLKDAAAAIYGSRAAGGVLLVTTKHGKGGKPQINASVSFSLKKPTGYFKQLNTAQVVEMDREANANAGTTSAWTDQQLADIKAGKVYPIDQGWSTVFTGSWNWTKLALGNGNQKNYNVSLSGSGKMGSYRASIGYLKEQGVYKYGNDNNGRLNARLNYDYNINDKLKVETILGFSRELRHQPSMDELFTIITMFPYLSPTVWDDKTKWANSFDNPMQFLSEGGTSTFIDTRLNANLKLDYKIIDGLTLTGQIGAHYTFDNSSQFYRTFDRYYPLDGHVIGKANSPNSGTEGNTTDNYSTEIGYINYVKSFNDLHNISITAGGSHEQDNNKFFNASRTGFPSNDFFSLNLGDAGSQINNGGGSGWAINSLFGRGSYIFDNKYIFESNFRYDGSSRFSPATRWGLFWGASAAWRLSEEDFIKKMGVFDNLKLRLSYGEVGNQDGIGLYDYLPRIIVGGNYPFGSGAGVTQASLGPLVDSSRTWETIQTKNVGLDFGFLKNRLTGSFDYFIKHNIDMLVPVTLPSVLGALPPQGNNGELKAWGWEAVLNWSDHISNDWSYSIGFNLSDSKNKVIKYGGQDTYVQGLVNVRQGDPIDTYYGMISDGIIKTQKQLDAYKLLGGVEGDIGIGDAMYKDVNHDGKISTYGDNGTSGDVVPIGSSTPRYIYGINLGLRFRSFEFSALIQGIGKREILIDQDWNMPWAWPWWGPELRWYHNTWSPDRPNNPNPRQTMGNIRWWNYQPSDRTLSNASYTRLKNISISYNLPQSLLSHIGIQMAKIYIVGFDILERQHLDGAGFDVETLSPTNTGVATYPFSKTYTVGLNITF